MLSNKVKRLLIRPIRCHIRSASVRDLSTAKDVNNLTAKPATNFRGDYDLIIAGGGMVGCTLACALGTKLYFFYVKFQTYEHSSE